MCVLCVWACACDCVLFSVLGCCVCWLLCDDARWIICVIVFMCLCNVSVCIVCNVLCDVVWCACLCNVVVFVCVVLNVWVWFVCDF